MRQPLPTSEEITRLPADGGPEFNRLVFESSPYLRQHARNPVDWYPWGDEAFARARREDKPIFLSVGYSTCHWCHVMERESFEEPDVAAVMNAHFVCVKVDREERPDIDEIYMNATMLLTSHGGWPNSVWLAADGRPFFAGTYFPREDRFGRPGFVSVLRAIAKSWQDNREAIESDADRLSEYMRAQAVVESGDDASSTPSRDAAREAIGALERTFDDRAGGFGHAPKFPPHGSLRILLYEYEKSRDEALLRMARRTLDGMSAGGVHDHIGGGFHRYSTDEDWFLPHFEKMLYDNAQLARAYTDAWRITSDGDYRRVAEGALDWALREMRDPQGGFYSALDADSEGEEGKFYLWTPEEIAAVLGAEEGRFFCRVYGIVKGGNFSDEATGRHAGSSIAHLGKPLADVARADGLNLDETRRRIEADRAKLLEARARRVRPHLDDKVLASWNGLMIGALAHAGGAFGRDDYTSAAARAADFVLADMRRDGRLSRSWRDGAARLNAYLDDYAFLAEGLLELHETTGDRRWLGEARSLADVMISRHRDAAEGGLYFTSDDHEPLLLRTKDPFDKAIPSGNGSAALALVRLAERTGEARYAEIARDSFGFFGYLLRRAPRASESLVLALAIYHDGKASKLAAPRRAAAERPSSDAKPDAWARKGPVGIQAFLSKFEAAPGETAHVALKLDLKAGWHINADKPLEKHLIPTRVAIADHEFVSAGVVEYPEGHDVPVPFSPTPLRVFEDGAWITVPLRLGAAARPGRATVAFEFHFQACDDHSCRTPEVLRLAVPLQVKGANSEPKK